MRPIVDRWGLAERLEQEAKEEDRRARSYDGCSFYGRHPGIAHRRQASLLRQAALALMDRPKTQKERDFAASRKITDAGGIDGTVRRIDRIGP